VYACYAATGLPIVGMGGVTTGLDAREFIACGALHVALGTVLFSDPDAPVRIREELAEVGGERVYALAHDAGNTLDLRAKVEV
jgi:dihydroorotate dehydrogenase (NAD+) catalytic subunit